MAKIIRVDDLREFTFRSLWELKSPKFQTEDNIAGTANMSFKNRHKGGLWGAVLNFLTPSRLYGLRKLFAWLLWLICALLIYGTFYAYKTETGNNGQVYMTAFFVGLYLLFFVKAGKTRIQKWERVYSRRVQGDMATHSNPVIVFDGQDMLLANEVVFRAMDGEDIAAFVTRKNAEVAKAEKSAVDAKKQAEREKDAARKTKEDAEFNAAVKDLGALLGSGAASAAKSSVKKSRQPRRQNQKPMRLIPGLRGQTA